MTDDLKLVGRLRNFVSEPDDMPITSADARRRLLRQRIDLALAACEPKTAAEIALVACLRAAIHEGLL